MTTIGDKGSDVPQYCMAINTGVLEVNSGGTVRGDDDLQFVVPTVRAGADLNTVFEVIGSA